MNTCFRKSSFLASLFLKLDFISYVSMIILVVLNLMELKNKPENLPINKKEGKALLLVINCRYLFIFIFKFLLDNNLIMHTKLER